MRKMRDTRSDGTKMDASNTDGDGDSTIQHAYIDVMAAEDPDSLKMVLSALYVGVPTPQGIDAARAALDAVDLAIVSLGEEDSIDTGTLLREFVVPAATAAGVRSHLVDEPTIEGYVLVISE